VEHSRVDAHETHEGKQNRFSVSEIFALFRVICGQKKSGAAAPHSKTSVLSVSSVVKLFRLFLAEFLESEIDEQKVPDRIQVVPTD
jgi:hypothetical protein